MGRIYQGLRTGATFIVLTGTCLAQSRLLANHTETLLWSQPSVMAAGDRFLAIGYARGVELWAWPPGSWPALSQRLPGEPTTAIFALDSTLYWCEEDGSLQVSYLSGSEWTGTYSRTLGAPARALSASRYFVAVVASTVSMLFASTPLESNAFQVWLPPGGAPLATLSIRDSTAAVAGADRVFLARLRSTGVEILDSLSLGAFVQAVQWAGDTLYLAFGFSGLKMIGTVGDRFVDTLQSWSSTGTFGHLALTERACTGLDLFGRVEVFERGKPLLPEARLAFDGTLRAAVGRGHEILILTAERGLALLNLFSIEAPFWAHRASLPGFVRDLLYSPKGVLALADFAGVYGLDGEQLVLHHPYNAVSLDLGGPHLAATSLLGGVAVGQITSDSNLPYAVVPTFGLGRRAVIADDRLFVAGDGACDTGFVVYQLSPPDAPVELERVSICGSVRDLAAGPGVLALALRDSGLRILDAASPGSPSLAATPAADTWNGLKWLGNDLWAFNSTGRLTQWHWDGVTLTEVDSWHVDALAGFDVWSQRLATADSSHRLVLWDVQAGGALSLVDSIRTEFVVSNLVLVADTVWAVDRDAILRVKWESTASVAEPTVRPEFVLLDRPYPNPFNGGVTLSVHVQPGPWSVEVINILGRTVQTWQGIAASPHTRRIIWNPATSDGAATGLYLLRAENGGIRECRKLMYLK